jgi:DNA-binding CsgD family transcriptional regulator
VFDVLDPDSDQGRVYRALTGHSPSDIPTLARRTNLAETAVAAALAGLAALDAVAERDGFWEARPPARVMSEVLREEETRRAAMWEAGAELDELYHAARKGSNDVEPVDDPHELFALTAQLQERSTEQVRWLDRPPYRSTAARFAEQESLQRRRMAAGLAYRTLYHQAVYDDTELFAGMTRMIEHGEDARVLADLPVKLLIGDDHAALLVPAPANGLDGALVIRTPGLLTALGGIFETLWTLGVPVTASDGAQLSERDRTIITLMAAGVTDDAIARRLHLSRRTVVRRITALLDRLGATTRFQAGVQAANRGWL